MNVDILISGESLGQKKIIETTTLLDTGAGGKFIDQNFVQNQKIETKKLKYPIEVFNVDGTPNTRNYHEIHPAGLDDQWTNENP
jgi:Retroviral aspartyl protease